MDISPAGPSMPPWLVAGALLVVLALIALGGGAALLARWLRNGRRRPAERAAGPAGRAPGSDDLPMFRDFPPGSAGAPGPPPAGGPPSAGWPALAGSGPAATTRVAGTPAGPPSRSGRPSIVLPTAVALAALVVLAAALVLDPGPRRSGPHPPGGPHGREDARSSPAPGSRTPGAGDLADVSVRPGRDGGAAGLAFGGLVLEQRAVGITATYPALDVTWNRDDAVAHLRLPTYNCLTATAPEDPVAAGCVPSITEYADLAAPALALTGDDGTIRLSGRFPTYVRPNGSPPVWSGRIYEFTARAAPLRGEPSEGWVRARGEIRLGDGRAPTLDGPAVRVLRTD